jgi:hypothetical protein
MSHHADAIYRPIRGISRSTKHPETDGDTAVPPPCAWNFGRLIVKRPGKLSTKFFPEKADLVGGSGTIHHHTLSLAPLARALSRSLALSLSRSLALSLSRSLALSLSRSLALSRTRSLSLSQSSIQMDWTVCQPCWRCRTTWRA